jgi:hypothetical protein
LQKRHKYELVAASEDPYPLQLLSPDIHLTIYFLFGPSGHISRHDILYTIDSLVKGKPRVVKMEMNYNDAELHRIEEELHMEILPGTEVR